MGLKSKDKHFSFEILASTSPLTIDRSNSDFLPQKSDRRKRKSRKKKSAPNSPSVRLENAETSPSTSSHSYAQSCTTTTTVCELRDQTSSTVLPVSQGELRQRNVSCGGFGDDSFPPVQGNSISTLGNGKLENATSLDWRRFMAEDPTYPFPVENSPIKFFMEEMYSGNSLRSTTTIGNEKERERVYDTIFRLPWRCELLIDVGFFVCLNSFLSLLTIIPMRAVVTMWRFLTKRFESQILGGHDHTHDTRHASDDSLGNATPNSML